MALPGNRGSRQAGGPGIGKGGHDRRIGVVEREGEVPQRPHDCKRALRIGPERRLEHGLAARLVELEKIHGPLGPGTLVEPGNAFDEAPFQLGTGRRSNVSIDAERQRAGQLASRQHTIDNSGDRALDVGVGARLAPRGKCAAAGCHNAGDERQAQKDCEKDPTRKEFLVLRRLERWT